MPLFCLIDSEIYSKTKTDKKNICLFISAWCVISFWLIMIECIWLWIVRCFFKFKENLVDLSSCSYQVHLLLMFIPLFFIHILHPVIVYRLYNLCCQHIFYNVFPNAWVLFLSQRFCLFVCLFFYLLVF